MTELLTSQLPSSAAIDPTLSTSVTSTVDRDRLEATAGTGGVILIFDDQEPG